MRFLNLEQGSDDWLRWREQGLGSSDAPIVMSRGGKDRNGRPWNTRENLLKQKRGEVATSRPSNSAMQRGKDLEPVARGLYEGLFGVTTQPACGLHDHYDFLKGSFDGLSCDHQLVEEIKAPNRDDHFLALEHNAVPDKYVDQVNHLLLVSGAQLAHYVSYSPQQPQRSRQLAVVPVARDEGEIITLLAHEAKFWSEVTGTSLENVLGDLDAALLALALIDGNRDAVLPFRDRLKEVA